MTSTRTDIPPLRGARWGGLAATAVAALAAAVALYAGGRSPAEKVVVTPDLAWVPPDAAVFVQIRGADLWGTDPVKALLQAFDKRPGKLAKELREELGMPVTEVEKVTLVFQSIGGLFGQGRGPGGPDLTIVTATNDDSLAAVRGQAVQVAGKTFRRANARPDELMYFVNKRTYVRGRAELIRKGVARAGKAEAAGPLVPALKRAMDRHHLVVGLQLNADAAEDVAAVLDIPDEGERRALAPLAAVRSGLLLADVGKETTATVELRFPDEARAGRGLRAAQDGLALLRIRVLGSLLAHAEFRLDDVSGSEGEEKVALGVLLLERLESALREVKAEQRGSVVRLSARAPTDMAALEKQSQVLAKARRGDDAAKLARLRRLSGNNLKQIMVALHSFHDVYKSLPPAAICDPKTGKPVLSWRVAILPFLEQKNLYNQFKLDEPWDGPTNKALLERMPAFYAPVGVKAEKPSLTFYREIVPGKGTGPTAWQTNVVKGRLLYGAVGARLPASFPDGTSNTIGVVEAGEAVPWTKPEPLVYMEKGALPKLGGHFKDGFVVGMMDGSVRFISSRALADPAAVQDLRYMITAADGMVISDRIEKYTRPVR
jgi:hypothetical protein